MKTKFKNIETNTIGCLPKVGDTAPNFKLAREDLSDMTLADLRGTKFILNIFPSLDTSVCALSVQKFNQIASNLKNTKVLCVSKDLPFAQKRFCVAEGLDNVITLSDIRLDSDFGKTYGVAISDGALNGLFARAIVAIDENGMVIYSALNREITEEPDYESAINSVSR